MTWGGARAGAGRPAKGPIASERHAVRPVLGGRHAVHVCARFVPGLRASGDRGGQPRASRRGRGLSRRRAYAALRRAIALSLARSDFRIVHFALLPTRLELIIEATDKHALARGMQGFQVSAARSLNRAARRRGTVFPDRYRMTIVRTRTEVRALAGGLPQMFAVAHPETWLVRIELAPRLHARRWIRTRADEDS